MTHRFFLALVCLCAAALPARALELELTQPTEFELATLGTLKGLLGQLSETKDVKVLLVSGLTAAEYQIYYHPADEVAIRGLGGVTQTAITTLLNELSIASQRDEARALKKPLDLRHRKFLLVRFVKLEQ